MTYILPPALGAFVLGLIACLTVWLQQPLLAPSLGAAVFSQLLHADEKSAAPYNLTAGQFIGGVAGLLGVFLAGQAHAPPLLGVHDLPAGRILAVLIATVLAMAGQMLARARTPTGGATALVVALGIETPTLEGSLRLLAGIALVMLVGEAARRLLLRAQKHSRIPST